MLDKTKETNQSNLYGQMTQDVRLINNLSPLGKSVLKHVEELAIKHRHDDEALILAVKQYGIDLKIMKH